MAVVKEKYQIVASIVLFNHSYAQVAATLTSLLAECCVDKIVLVDNGGAGWAASLCNDRICYINSGCNGGFGRGHNLAMREYLDQCDYFLICNPDISFEAGSLVCLHQFAYEGGHQFVSPRIHYSDGRFQYSCRLLPTPANLLLRRFLPRLSAQMDMSYELHMADYKKVFSVPTVSGCFMLIASPLLKRLGGFDERYFMYMEDIDLCRRALSHTEIVYFSGATITHVFGKGSYENVALLGHHIRSAFTYFNKWGWFFDRDRKKINMLCLRSIPMTSPAERL
ncbi:glycosyltransferase [Serratia marcescens]|uniref:glycosyltransferase n=1 Tax=Serratia TaxID=613 RepID=UPI0002B8578A|nr:glycosyltransferase [Serratia marcescens]EMF03850.1 family 2 glycosyl transferase [Serratia marcescens VGH107]MEB6082061.1 glycosyltransferase [Serratia marcescens]TBU70091.1 glycosyltransferase [Serratia marcescens]WHS72055.1 glycosyltransferase [Serratia marcescens]WJD89450.1 glycosyltransferase [Serratia marcescens]